MESMNSLWVVLKHCLKKMQALLSLMLAYKTAGMSANEYMTTVTITLLG